MTKRRSVGQHLRVLEKKKTCGMARLQSREALFGVRKECDDRTMPADNTRARLAKMSFVMDGQMQSECERIYIIEMAVHSSKMFTTRKNANNCRLAGVHPCKMNLTEMQISTPVYSISSESKPCQMKPTRSTTKKSLSALVQLASAISPSKNCTTSFAPHSSCDHTAQAASWNAPYRRPTPQAGSKALPSRRWHSSL
jgi:hypothetical protein